jgi:phenylpyruvate tautomerase PptA (4-oxalocrotonate tautomerase family)
MPIVDIQVVASAATDIPGGAAKTLVEAVATVLQAAPGKVWLRLGRLDAGSYAENGEEQQVLPVFVKVLHADLPTQSVLVTQASALAHAVAACFHRSPEHVHIEYAPPGRGRVAFGGELLQ